MLFEAPCNIKNMILFGWPLECLCMCIFYCHNRSSINVPWTGKLNGRAVFLFQQLIWSGWGPMDNTCFTFGPQKMFRDSVHTWIRTNKIRFYTFPCKFFRQRSVFGVKMLYILTKRVFFSLNHKFYMQDQTSCLTIHLIDIIPAKVMNVLFASRWCRLGVLWRFGCGQSLEHRPQLSGGTVHSSPQRPGLYCYDCEPLRKISSHRWQRGNTQDVGHTGRFFSCRAHMHYRLYISCSGPHECTPKLHLSMTFENKRPSDKYRESDGERWTKSQREGQRSRDRLE